MTEKTGLRVGDLVNSGTDPKSKNGLVARMILVRFTEGYLLPTTSYARIPCDDSIPQHPSVEVNCSGLTKQLSLCHPLFKPILYVQYQCTCQRNYK